jgi:hypothetical protein
VASLVQDVWIGFEHRSRARRLAPWQPPAARLLFQLDAGARLDDPRIAGFLDVLGGTIEVIACELRARGGVLGPELLDDARRLAAEGARGFGELRLFLGGYGLGAWLALAAAPLPGVCGTVALAPSLANAGSAGEHPSPLRAALAAALSDAPPPDPVLLIEGRSRPAAEARIVSEWLAQRTGAAHLVAPGGDADLLAPPWPGLIAAWVGAVGRQ